MVAGSGRLQKTETKQGDDERVSDTRDDAVQEQACQKGTSSSFSTETKVWGTKVPYPGYKSDASCECGFGSVGSDSALRLQHLDHMPFCRTKLVPVFLTHEIRDCCHEHNSAEYSSNYLHDSLQKTKHVTHAHTRMHICHKHHTRTHGVGEPTQGSFVGHTGRAFCSVFRYTPQHNTGHAYANMQRAAAF